MKSIGNTKKGIRLTDMPYFISWDVWLNVLDKSNHNLRGFIKDATIKYITNRQCAPATNSHKSIWEALHKAASLEGITPAALIEKACAEELNISMLAQNAPPVINVEKKKSSIFDLNRDVRK